MDGPVPAPALELDEAQLFAWARSGLLRFEQQGVVDHAGEIAALEADLGRALSGYAQMQRDEIDLLLAEQIRQADCGLAALVAAPQRDLPQLYLFTLCSAIELDPGLAPLLARTQGRPGWLQQGFAAALLAFLFPDAPPLDIADGELARRELLMFDGPGPAVLRHVYSSRDYWNALRHDRLPSEYQPLPAVDDEPTPAALLDSAAALLGRRRGLVLQADAHCAAGFLRRLAAQLGRRPVRIGYNDWRQRPLRALAHYAGWLPLVDCLGAEGGLIEADDIGRQALLLTRADQPLPEAYVPIDLPPPDAAQRHRWWQRWVSDPEALPPLAAAALSQAAIARIGDQLAGAEAGDALQRVRRIRGADGSRHLRRVALAVDTHVSDRMLVFADDTRAALECCYQRCLRRDYRDLGMGETIRATASPGVTLLFSGSSGTGKTLACSWLASRLGAPLYKIDLAMVMNKYVGETEKNLSLALNEAAKADVLLLFDEADALFGQRSDGAQGGDRFANMLTNFLLSKIETHPGIVALTTNAGSRMDKAFQRRIDLAVEFRPLAYPQRLQLWRSLLAQRDPGPALCQRIARHCELAPGHVRNIVINASCWYPEQCPLTAAALWHALDEEYRKAGRSMPSQLLTLRDGGTG